jgi:prophage regulatory protein
MIPAKQPVAETEQSAPERSGPRRMLTERQILEIIPIGRSTLWRLERAGKFPRGVFISPNRKIWYESQIVSWQDSLDQSDPRRGRGKRRRCQMARRQGGDSES